MTPGSVQNCSRYWTFTPSLPPETEGCCQKRNRAGLLSPRIAGSAEKIEAVTALFCHHSPPKTSPCKSNPWANFLATDWRAELILPVCTEQHLPANSWPAEAKLGATACCLQWECSSKPTKITFNSLKENSETVGTNALHTQTSTGHVLKATSTVSKNDAWLNWQRNAFACIAGHEQPAGKRTLVHESAALRDGDLAWANIFSNVGLEKVGGDFFNVLLYVWIATLPQITKPC